MPAARRAERAAALSLGVTVVLAVAKFVVWGATSSLVVLSQALDSLLDIVALGLVFVGVRVAGRPADSTHHYGHQKAENLAAFAQTLLIAIVVVGVAFEAVLRLDSGRSDVAAPWYAIALLGASIVVDAARVAYLLRTARADASEALRAGAINIAGDLGTAVVALVSLILVRAGFTNADPIGGIIVAAVVAVAALRVARRSVDVLMDRAPALRAEAIEAAAARAAGVSEARRVRVRGSGDSLFADVTVAAGRTSSLERAHDIAENVEREIENVVPGIDVVVHVEPQAEDSSVIERAHAAASRAAGIHEVHNVLVHAFDEGGKHKLHVTLHAKVQPGLSLEAAHGLADRVEASIQEELGGAVRVDTHIEPLEPAAPGRDVTGARGDIVGAVEALAEAEPEVLDCHEVLVTSSGGTLAVVAHVRGDRDLELAQIHDASTRIENNLRAQHPEIGSVLIHFEPN